ncbi:hypothetical protein ABPG74_006077 [Tetrahymena malaccensis]
MDNSFQEDSQDTYLFSTQQSTISKKASDDSSQDTFVFLHKNPKYQQDCKTQIQRDENNLDALRLDKQSFKEQNNFFDDDSEWDGLFQGSTEQNNEIFLNNYHQNINNNQPLSEETSNKIYSINQNDQINPSLFNERVANQDYKGQSSFIENPFEIIFDGKVQENDLPSNNQQNGTIINQFQSYQSRQTNTFVSNNNQNDFNYEDNETNESLLDTVMFNQSLPNQKITEQNNDFDNPAQSLFETNIQQINNLSPNNENNNQSLSDYSRQTCLQIQNSNFNYFSNGNSSNEILNSDFVKDSQQTVKQQQNSCIDEEIQTDISEDLNELFTQVEQSIYQQCMHDLSQDKESQFNYDRSFNQDSKQDIMEDSFFNQEKLNMGDSFFNQEKMNMEDSFFNQEKLNMEDSIFNQEKSNNQANTLPQVENINQSSEIKQELPRQLNEQTQQNQQRRNRRIRKKRKQENEQQTQQNLQKKRRNRKKGELNQFGKKKNQETQNLATNIFNPLFKLLKTYYPQIKNLETNSFKNLDKFLLTFSEDQYEDLKKNMLQIVDTLLIKKASLATSEAQYEILKYLPGLKMMIQNRGKFKSIKQANKFAMEIYKKNNKI